MLLPTFVMKLRKEALRLRKKTLLLTTVEVFFSESKIFTTVNYFELILPVGTVENIEIRFDCRNGIDYTVSTGR